MKTVCIIGHFGGDKFFCEGQTVKTKVLTKALQDALGQEQVATVDTYGGVKALPRCALAAMAALKNCRNVVILPAQNGVRIFAPLLVAGNLFFGRKLHYSVVGGWLPAFLENKPVLRWVLKKFHGIYVETNHMKTSMEAAGFKNITIIPNCKDIRVLQPEELIYPTQKPYRLCTFSRVTQHKGIEEAMNAVKAINEKHGETVYTLDIYGKIDPDETEWFADLQKSFPEYITYKGMAPFEQSVEILKDYFALLFPTRYFTEGIPGTIIDAYAAGVPVISAIWQNYGDMINDDTGIGVPFGDAQAWITVLEDVAKDPDALMQKKTACLKRAQEFLPQRVMDALCKRL